MKCDIWCDNVTEKQNRIFQIFLVPVSRSKADKMSVVGKSFFWWSASVYKELKELRLTAVVRLSF